MLALVIHEKKTTTDDRLKNKGKDYGERKKNKKRNLSRNKFLVNAYNPKIYLSTRITNYSLELP